MQYLMLGFVGLNLLRYCRIAYQTLGARSGFYTSYLVSITLIFTLASGATWYFWYNTNNAQFAFMVQLGVFLVTGTGALIWCLRRRVHLQVKKFSQLMGIKAKTKISGISNARATYTKRGKPLVLFSPDFAGLPLDIVAFIAAHEVGHLALNHAIKGSARQSSKKNLSGYVFSGAGAAAGFILGGPIAAAVAGVSAYALDWASDNWLDAGYSYKQEFEADAISVILGLTEGYDLESYLGFLAALVSIEPKKGFVSKTITRFSGADTHPDMKKRLHRIREIGQFTVKNGPDNAWRKYLD